MYLHSIQLTTMSVEMIHSINPELRSFILVCFSILVIVKSSIGITIERLRDTSKFNEDQHSTT